MSVYTYVAPGIPYYEPEDSELVGSDIYGYQKGSTQVLLQGQPAQVVEFPGLIAGFSGTHTDFTWNGTILTVITPGAYTFSATIQFQGAAPNYDLKLDIKLASVAHGTHTVAAFKDLFPDTTDRLQTLSFTGYLFAGDVLYMEGAALPGQNIQLENPSKLFITKHN